MGFLSPYESVIGYWPPQGVGTLQAFLVGGPQPGDSNCQEKVQVWVVRSQHSQQLVDGWTSLRKGF